MVRLFMVWLKKNWNRAALIFILILILINSVLIIYNRNIIRENVEIMDRILLIDEGLASIDKNIKFAEIGSRAFMLIQDEKFLGPYTSAITWYQKQLTDLEVLLEEEGFDISEMEVARKAVEDYMNTLTLMIDLSRNGNVDEALEIFESNPGSLAWQTYSPIVNRGIDFSRSLKENADARIKRSVNLILYLQSFLILLGMPIIIFAVLRIARSEKLRTKLFRRLLVSNKQYVFDNGQESTIEDEEAIIQSLIHNLNHATQFISQITHANYDIQWEGLDEENKKANQSNIAGRTDQNARSDEKSEGGR